MQRRKRSEDSTGKSAMASNSAAASSSNLRERYCKCGGRLVSYRVKQGVNKGRLFWRCPFWKTSTTCDLFIWDEDMAEGMEQMEHIEDGDSQHQTVKEAVALAIEVLEEGKKKTAKVQKKLNAERMFGKIKSILLIVSLMVNVYFALFCGCVKPNCTM